MKMKAIEIGRMSEEVEVEVEEAEKVSIHLDACREDRDSAAVVVKETVSLENQTAI